MEADVNRGTTDTLGVKSEPTELPETRITLAGVATCLPEPNLRRRLKLAAGLKTRGFLNPKECWKLWTELGSLGAVSETFLKRGEINPRTGNPPTKSGIEKSAFAWALENQAEARKDLTYAWSREGQVLTDEKWQDFVINASKLIYYERPKKLKEFITQHGLQHLF